MHGSRSNGLTRSLSQMTQRSIAQDSGRLALRRGSARPETDKHPHIGTGNHSERRREHKGLNGRQRRCPTIRVLLPNTARKRLGDTGVGKRGSRQQRCRTPHRRQQTPEPEPARQRGGPTKRDHHDRHDHHGPDHNEEVPIAQDITDARSAVLVKIMRAKPESTDESLKVDPDLDSRRVRAQGVKLPLVCPAFPRCGSGRAVSAGRSVFRWSRADCGRWCWPTVEARQPTRASAWVVARSVFVAVDTIGREG